MKPVLSARTLHVSIARPPGDVYAFVSNPENLPRWVAGLCKSIRRSDARWIVETPGGPLRIRFVENNDLGVLDHYVSVSPGVEVYVPMRVLPNGTGVEVIFTLFRQPDMSDQKSAEDAALVENDLRVLNKLLEA